MPNPFHQRNFLVDVLAILFGISGWIGITAIFLELPLIVDKAPEGWKLPSYIAILVQVGNIANLIYILYDKYSPCKISDGHLILAMLISGCVAAIGLAFLYHQTAEINGREHSIWLLVFAGVFAAIGCLSSVLSMPYMGRFKEIYLVTYMFGQGLNGFISSILSLIQGSGGPPTCVQANATEAVAKDLLNSGPTFGPKIFFLFVSVMMALSTISFILLHNLSQCKREHALSGVANSRRDTKRFSMDMDMYEVIPTQQREMTHFTYIYLMLLIGAISFIGYGIFPGLQAYSCRPYGIMAYHLSATLSAFANPIACITAMFRSNISLRNLFAQTAGISIISAYLLYTAIESPSPPFVGTWLGTILVISAWTVFQGMSTYLKIVALTMFRSRGGKSLVWAGSMTQLSACIGAIAMFIAVNNTGLFMAVDEATC